MERKVALETLGFTTSDSPNEDEIRRAFKKIALVSHPDKGGDPGKFNDVKNAMDTLLTAPPDVDPQVLEKTWHRYVAGEVDLGNLLKKYFNTKSFTVREEKIVAITISDYHNKVPVTVDGYGKYIFEHLGENETDEYILTPYLINDDHFRVVHNLDISQKVECSLSTLLFGGEIKYRDLSGEKIRVSIKSSKKIMNREVIIRKRGLTSENRTGDMIVRLVPNFDNTDFKKVVEHKKLLSEIFK